MEILFMPELWGSLCIICVVLRNTYNNVVV